jgi:hypothetical protein
MKTWLFSMVLLIITLNIQATDYYVSKSGNDANPGTESQPWLTIQKAANTLRAGDTVYIKTGVYKEIVEPKYSGSANNYITYTTYPGNIVTIDGKGVTIPAGWGSLIYISEVSYIKIKGLWVFNAGPDDNHAGILLEDASFIILQNNYTYNTASSGIGAWNCTNIIIDGNEVELACHDGEQECITIGGVSGFEVKNNHVHRNGAGSIGGEGICLKDGSHDGKVHHNHVHHLNDRLGIYVDAWNKHTYNIEVYCNIVHDIDGADCYTLAAESGGLLENISFYNNIGYNGGYIGINISINGEASIHPMKDIKIINNTLYNNGIKGWGGGILIENPDIQNVVIRNNILSQNNSFQMAVETHLPSGGLTVDHNLIHGFRNYNEEVRGNDYVEGDPLFVNSGSADFHLKKGSPAIDYGSSQGAPTMDYDGISRPQGMGFDIGAFEYQSSSSAPQISLSTTILNFNAIFGSASTLDSSFTVSNSGTGTLNWSISNNDSWINTQPQSGADSGTVTVTVEPVGLSVGTYTGTITVSSPNASNSPQTVTVNLTVNSQMVDAPPFGSFDTPIQGSTVSGSIPVTGWALDDSTVESVQIFREPEAGEGYGLVFIGDAIFVEGARPDITVVYPGYPNNNSAGWGYMMLTNFLPHNGNGAFTLHAIATDSTGHSTTLGTKVIHCDNAHAVKPFGAIDTPIQGGTASGKDFINWGWVLTPQPNLIPEDGSTINVWVDGINLGQPTYNIFRSDVAAKFPGYKNAKGAIGYFSLDTMAYDNGVHTIQWTATDSAGNTDGIGSRYFTVQNTGADTKASEVRRQKSEDRTDLSRINVDTTQSILIQKGFKRDNFEKPIFAQDGIYVISIKELEPLRIKFTKGSSIAACYQLIGNTARRLPAGMTLRDNAFTWMPGLAYLGNFRFVVLLKARDGGLQKRYLDVTINPKQCEYR